MNIKTSPLKRAARAFNQIMLLCILASVSSARAQDLVRCEIVHGFLGGTNDGEWLNDSVIEGRDGRLYGTTINGGTADGGTVFAMAKDGGGYLLLHQFTGAPNDGLSPWDGVVQGQDGRLYGATRHGGAQDAGIVFTLSTDGTGFAIVRSFTTNANDGAFPLNTVIQASDGRLYGRTLSGGTNNGNSIFGLNTNGTGYALLYSFNSTLPDYYDTFSGLIEGSDGLLYGTTYHDGALGHGSVFRLRKDGTGFQSLHDFLAGGTDGGHPYGGIYETREGVLYGVTARGGPDNNGALYRINRDGTGYAVLRYFVSTGSEGYVPVGAPVEGPGDLLYGTTYYGGPTDVGTIYSVRKDGTGFAWLYQFKWPGPDGAYPDARLTRGSDGALYGTTYDGSRPPRGSVFRIKPVVLVGRHSTGQFTLRFEGCAGQHYSLEAADSLPSDWTAIATLTNLTGVLEWPAPLLAPPPRFFRAQLLNP